MNFCSRYGFLRMIPRLLCVAVMLAASTSFGRVQLAEGRLAVDGTLWANARWREQRRTGFLETSAEFFLRGAFLGVEATPSDRLTFRYYLEAARIAVLDLYADLRLAPGFHLRAGQFVLPVGREVLIPNPELKLVEYSLLRRYWKPYDYRDVGLMATYDRHPFDIAAAVVNGTGRNNLADNNSRKDLCVRIAVRPWRGRDIGLAVRGYYGWMRIDGSDPEFRQVGVELFSATRSLDLAAELQHVIVPGGSQVFYTRTSGYVEAAHRPLELLELVARIQAELQAEDGNEWGPTVAINVTPWLEPLKLTLAYDYLVKNSKLHPELSGVKQDVTLQLQAGF